jgi:hypothetical protein
MANKKDVFTVRIVYKSGYTHDFDVFSFSKEGRRYNMEFADPVKRPIDLGADEIAAIWQVGHKVISEKTSTTGNDSGPK